MSRKKVLTPEAQYVINVLDECVHRINVLSLLPCELAQAECVSEVLGNTAVESLREHLRVYEVFNTDTSKDESVTRAVQDTLRNFLRHVKTYNQVETVKAALLGAGPISEEDQKAVQELGAGLQGLRSVLMERLMTTPREEREHRRHGQEVRERQQRNMELLHTLEQEVTSATKRRDHTISKKDGEIQHMKDSLHQMKRMWEEFVLQAQKKSEQQHLSDLKNSEMKRLHLQVEANQLQAQLDLLTAQHREREATLKKENNKLEAKIENWIQKYDEEMEENQTKLERLTQAYEKERAELAELKEHMAVLDLEHSQIMEERRMGRERREEEERERERQSRAAVVIQALWRGWRVRKAMKNKSKGKKGKKGKARKGK